MASRIQKKQNHSIRKFILCLCGLILLLGIGYGVITTNYKLDSVIVVGSTRNTEQEIIDKLVTKKTDQITFLMYLRYKFNDTPKIPFVEKMDISMEDKHTIKVTVYEKIVVGCVEMMDSYMYFDKDGIVVESSKERIEHVPLVTGLKFDKIILHQKLEIQKESLFTLILNLTKLIQKFNLNADKLFISSDYEVTLYCDGNEVLLGKRDYYDVQFSALKSVLESAPDKKLSYDLRHYDENNTKITAKPIE